MEAGTPAQRRLLELIRGQCGGQTDETIRQMMGIWGRPDVGSRARKEDRGGASQRAGASISPKLMCRCGLQEGAVAGMAGCPGLHLGAAIPSAGIRFGCGGRAT